MTRCSFEVLVKYLDHELTLDRKLELLEHIEECETCRDAMYHIARDRDADLFVHRPYRLDKVLQGCK